MFAKTWAFSLTQSPHNQYSQQGVEGSKTACLLGTQRPSAARALVADPGRREIIGDQPMDEQRRLPRPAPATAAHRVEKRSHAGPRHIGQFVLIFMAQPVARFGPFAVATPYAAGVRQFVRGGLLFLVKGSRVKGSSSRGEGRSLP